MNDGSLKSECVVWSASAAAQKSTFFGYTTRQTRAAKVRAQHPEQVWQRGVVEGDGGRQPDATYSPAMESAAALETMAKTAAAETLPLELERLGAEGQRELAARYETSPDKLVGVLTDRHIDGLLNPLGTATPKLQATTPASEGRIVADLYWRCCVAMQMSAPCESRTVPACLPAACVYACVCVYAYRACLPACLPACPPACLPACVYACVYACVCTPCVYACVCTPMGTRRAS
eukprot:scaffold10913_cov60-Phaeocystis_antarctica.AAC.1